MNQIIIFPRSFHSGGSRYRIPPDVEIITKNDKLFLEQLKKYSRFINSDYYNCEYLPLSANTNTYNAYYENYYTTISCPSNDRLTHLRLNNSRTLIYSIRDI